MIIAPQHPNSVRIRFTGKKFECNDSNIEGRIDPRAKPKFDEFMSELNKLSKRKCLTFPYYIYLFLLGYIGSFIAIMSTGKWFLLFIPISCFAAFFIGIIWFSVSIQRFVGNLNKLVDKYRVELSPYYNVINQISLYRRRYDYSSTDQAIVLSPIDMQMHVPVMPGQYYAAPMQNYNPQTHGMQFGANYHQNVGLNNQQFQGQYFPQNGNEQYMHPPGTFPPPQMHIPPPQPIPVYNYNPQNLQDITQVDIEDDPVKNRGENK